jgi:predicted esterase
MPPVYHTIEVPRHARIGVVGEPDRAESAWLVLHGYAMLAQGILHWFRAAAEPRRLLVAPEGLSRFYLEEQGVRRVGASWMTREDREHELEDLLGYLDRVVERFVPSRLPLQVHGFSQGVAAAARWIVRGRRPVSRLVCWGATIPHDVPLDVLRRALPHEGLHFVTGSRDTRVPALDVEQDAERLRAGGLAPVVHRFDGGHRVDETTLARLAS